MILAARTANFAEWYSEHIYPIAVESIGRVCGMIPFSVSEIGIYILILALLITLIRMIVKSVHSHTLQALPGWLSGVLLAVGILAFLYTACCGINYHRKSFSEEEGIVTYEYSADELKEICIWLTEEINVRADDVGRDEHGILELEASEREGGIEAMQSLAEEFPVLEGYYPQPKALIISEILSYQGLTGIYLPFTVEANYNGDMPAYDKPFTVCHELSHLRGFMEEQEYEVTANSALSEYLAVNMMNANTMISLADFPESSDQSYLQDAWEEAVYQNPMILGVTNASICGNGEMLAVTYDTEADAIREKQEEIAAETERVVSEIITDDMSELEKEIAINQYLCDTAEYDTAALENAGENDFEDVDDEFNDSFTPYGVLLNKAGVCSSYAGAFKLLAEEAGLECIVVTGYLDGELPHAWNKVKIDGEWQIVDSTNNDNELIFNTLLNLPDTAADKVLVEDERYVLDSKLDSYQANTDEKEYYHINNRFYEQDQIPAPLAEELKKEGPALLRTDYTLSDEQFMTIAQQAADRYGADELGGCYWMGVIYLTDEY